MVPKIPREVRFTKSARKHRVGKAHVKYVITNCLPIVAVHPEGLELTWIGLDDRGVELEVIGINLGTYLLIIHVMPSIYRKRKKNGN